MTNSGRSINPEKQLRQAMAKKAKLATVNAARSAPVKTASPTNFRGNVRLVRPAWLGKNG